MGNGNEGMRWRRLLPSPRPSVIHAVEDEKRAAVLELGGHDEVSSWRWIPGNDIIFISTLPLHRGQARFLFIQKIVFPVQVRGSRPATSTSQKRLR